jgi:hypothetical protein
MNLWKISTNLRGRNMSKSLIEVLLADKPEDASLRIKIGRKVVYKGTIKDVEVNHLTVTQTAILSSLLVNPSPNSATGDLLAASSENNLGTVNITVNGESTLRLCKGILEVNTYSLEVPVAEVENHMIESPDPDAVIAQVMSNDPAPVNSQDNGKIDVFASLSNNLQTSKPVQDLISRFKKVPTLPAMGIALKELHDAKLKAPTLSWLSQQASKIHPELEPVARVMAQKGTEITVVAAKEVHKRFSQLSTSARKAAVSHGLRVILNACESLSEQESGETCRFAGENYTISREGERVTLANHKGEVILAFTPKFNVAIQVHDYRLNWLQEAEIVGAAYKIGANKIPLKTMSPSELRNLMNGYAPEGNSLLVTQQSGERAKVLLESRLNMAEDGELKHKGYVCFRDDTGLVLSAPDDRGEILRVKQGQVITIKLTSVDQDVIEGMAQQPKTKSRSLVMAGGMEI